MKLNVNAEQARKILAFLESDEDCERLLGNEFVADLYGEEIPLTLNLHVEGGEIELLAAAQMLYDPQLDAYYMGDAVDDAQAVAAALIRAAEPEGK